MQVSWIDPNEVSGLLAGLEPGRPAVSHDAPAPALPVISEAEAPGWSAWISELTDPPARAPVPETPDIFPSGHESAEDGEPALAETASEKEIDSIRERLRHIREQAVIAGLLQRRGTPVENATTVQERGNAARERDAFSTADLCFDAEGELGARLETFAEWARGRFKGADILVVDEHGDLLWGPPNAAGLVLSTLMALNSARRESAGAFSSISGLMTREIAPGRNLTLIACSSSLGLLQAAVVGSGVVSEEDAAVLREGLARVAGTED